MNTPPLNLYLCLSMCLLVGIHCQSPMAEPGLQYHPLGKNAWHVEAVPSTGQWAVATYQGEIGLFHPQSQEASWIHSSDAFVMDLKVADLDQDGREEIVYVNVSGRLQAMDLEGNLLFDFQSDLPLHTLAIGNLQADEGLEIACGGIDRHVYVMDAQGRLIAQSEEVERLVFRLGIGNLDEDETEELLAIENRVTANLMELQGGALVSVMRKDLKVPEEYVNWENPRGSFYPFSLTLEDLNGDGQDEIIGGDAYFNKQAVAVFDAQLEAQWISERVPSFEMVDGAQTEFYSTAFVRAAELFAAHEGKEIVSVAGGLLRVWNREGELLGSQNGPVGFADFFIDGTQLCLASSPNGDDHVYELTLDENWENHLSQIQYRGHIAEIKAETAELAQKIQAYQPEGELPSEQTYDLVLGFSSLETKEEWFEAYQQEVAWFQERFPYANLRVIKNLKVIEDTPPLKPDGEPWNLRRYKLDGINGVMTVEEILEKARWVEEHNIPTLFYIGHSCTPFITLETAEKILQLAPTACIGFRTAEDEQIEMVPEYFEHYFGPLTELCLKYGYKQTITKNKGIWWMSTPSVPEMYEAVLEGEARKVFVAATEDSNSRTPEMNLMGRGGLWQAGLIAGNDVSIHGDLFSFNRFQQWEYPKVGHPYLRLLVAHTTMGMTYGNSRIRDINRMGDSLYFSQAGQESTELFYHLLGKGLVFSPKREQAVGYSPLGMVVHRPPDIWLTDAHNGHRPERWVEDERMHQAVFPHNGSLWGMTNTPEHAFQHVIFQKERQYGYQMPATPYGLVAFVPSQADTNDVANVNRWLHTDGLYVWKGDGPKLNGEAAAELLRREFEAAAQDLPFRMQGYAFLQTLQLSDDRYRLYVVDPGWVDPADREVVIQVQLEGSFRVKDLLKQDELSMNNRQIPLTVPAGLFRILEVERLTP